MEIKLSPFRLSLLAICIAGFWLWGGFSPLSVEGSYASDRHVTEAWMNCVIMFLTGAVNISIIDHWVGTLDRTNIRMLYVLLGLGLMGVSCLWLQNLRGALSAG